MSNGLLLFAYYNLKGKKIKKSEKKVKKTLAKVFETM